MRWQWIAIAATLVATGAAVGVTVRHLDPDRRAAGPPEIVSSVSPTPQTDPERLVCTTASEPANFGLYALGKSFQGHGLTTVHRGCRGRRNTVSYSYGTCEPPPMEGGCPAPLEVQVWPACMRGVSSSRVRRAVSRRRGVPTVRREGSVELYTGNSTVIVFGDDRELVDGAVRSLRMVRRGAAPRTWPPPLTPTATALPEPLAGAVSGRLSCRAASR